MSRIVMSMIRPLCYGASRMAADYAVALRQRGHEVHICFAKDVSGGDSDDSSILPKVTAAGVTSQHVPELANYLNPLRRNPLCQIIKSRKTDAVISINMRDAPAALKAAYESGVPGVVFALNALRFTGPPVIRSLKKWLYISSVRRYASHVVCCSNGVARDMALQCRLGNERFSVAPNGIDVSSIPEVRPDVRASVRAEFGLTDEILLVNLARIHVQKGHVYLIDAVRKLRDLKDCPNFTILIAGDVESRKEMSLKLRLLHMIQAYGLQRHIRLIGYRRDGNRLLQGSDGFVLSSVWEGLPLAVLEAMGARCPVVMTDYGDRFENFCDGRDGLYASACDSDSLAKSLRALLRMSTYERALMGQRGRAYVERHLTRQRGADLFVRAVEAICDGSPRLA